MGNSIDDLFADRDVPPHTGGELVAVQVADLRRRVANLERALLRLGVDVDGSSGRGNDGIIGQQESRVL